VTAAAEAKARQEAALEERRRREAATAAAAEAEACREAEAEAYRRVTAAAEAKARKEVELVEARRRREAEIEAAARKATAAVEAKARKEAHASTGAALKGDAGDSRLLAFLASIGQEHALPLFAKEDVDFETLEMCDPTELSDMLTSLGLKMGARKKILKARSASSAASNTSEIDRLNRQAKDSAKHQARLELALDTHRAQLEKLRGVMKQSGVPREYECPIRRV
jgi:hypothetical protein